MVTPCDDLDGGEVEVVLGTSHRVAPRTTALTCRPIQGLSAKMILLEQEEEWWRHITIMTIAEDISWISRLTMRPAETLSAAWGSDRKKVIGLIRSQIKAL